MKTHWVPVLLLLIFVILLSGCSSDSARSQPLDSIWSRGLSVGISNLREPAAITVADQGRKAHLIWGQKGDYGTDIHYTRIDRESGVELSENLQSGLFLPRSYRLFVTPRGQVHLLTLAKSNKDGVSGVYHLQISDNAELVSRPKLVTPPDHSVEAYGAVMLPDGQASLVWESSRETGGGLYQRKMDWGNDAIGDDIVMVNASGKGPSLALGETGVLHLIWYVDDGKRGVREIFYADFPQAMVETSDGLLLTTFGRSDSASYSRPVIGYDDSHIYVFWHSKIVAGMEAGTGKTLFLAFPKERPQAGDLHEILIPDLPGMIAPASNGKWYAPISPGMALVSSSYVIYPSPISSTAPELPLLLSAKMTYRMQEAMQPMMAVLTDGVQVGYAPVARTDHLSYFPVGVRDGMKDAYSVWLDYRGGGHYPVYLSATSPEWKAGALRISGRAITTDVSRELAFGLLAVVALTPMLLLILLLPLAWIVILLLLGRAEHLDTRNGRIELGVAIAIFYVTKIAAFLSLFGSPSLLRTMPQTWASVFLVVLPVSIFLIASISLWAYVRRADPPGLPTGFFLFAITDLTLTALVYGPTLYT